METAQTFIQSFMILYLFVSACPAIGEIQTNTLTEKN